MGRNRLRDITPEVVVHWCRIRGKHGDTFIQSSGRRGWGAQHGDWANSIAEENLLAGLNTGEQSPPGVHTIRLRNVNDRHAAMILQEVSPLAGDPVFHGHGLRGGRFNHNRPGVFLGAALAGDEDADALQQLDG
jgi:hypothetical protein